MYWEIHTLGHPCEDSNTIPSSAAQTFWAIKAVRVTQNHDKNRLVMWQEWQGAAKVQDGSWWAMHGFRTSLRWSAWQCQMSTKAKASQQQRGLEYRNPSEANRKTGQSQWGVSWSRSENHRVVWIGRHLKDHPVPAPLSRHLPLEQVSQSPIWPSLEHSWGGTATALLANLCQCLTTVKNFSLISNLTVPSVSLKPFPLVPSLHALAKSLSLVLLL